MRLSIISLLLTFALGCADKATGPPQLETEFAHTVERYSDLCHFDFSDDLFSSAKRLSTHQWAKDRYRNGLEIEWNIRDRTIRESPVMRQALNLVADTLYALVLPTQNIRTLEVFVDVADLSDDSFWGWSIAQAGGDFYTSGPRWGLPFSGQVGITIDDHELNFERKPRYINSLDEWYIILLHEALHVLGFGTSTKWESIISKKRFDYFLCGLEIFRGHWYSPSYEGIGRPIMFSSLSTRRITIAPETLCALDAIGWNLRGRETRPRPDDAPRPQPGSQDATLLSLSVHPGDLKPAFAPSIMQYSVDVGYSVDEITFSASANHRNATALVVSPVDGVWRGSGSRKRHISSTKSLNVGQNLFAVEVIAEDRSASKLYSISVLRQEAPEPEPEPQPEPTTAPPKPTNLQVGSIAATSAWLSWDASAGATLYWVTYKPTQGGDWTTQHTGTALHKTIEHLERDTKYLWAVKAQNDAGESDWVYGPNFTTKRE